MKIDEHSYKFHAEDFRMNRKKNSNQNSNQIKMKQNEMQNRLACDLYTYTYRMHLKCKASKLLPLAMARFEMHNDFRSREKKRNIVDRVLAGKRLCKCSRIHKQ